MGVTTKHSRCITVSITGKRSHQLTSLSLIAENKYALFLEGTCYPKLFSTRILEKSIERCTEL